MTLPNFLIIGAQKAGTSWLGRQLDQHPEIFCYPKEIHFFDKDYNYARGLGWYEEHFRAARPYKAIGEKTPDYLWANGQGCEGHLPEVHNNVHVSVATAKLIVILRNPVDRAISAVRHIIRSGRVSPFQRIDDLLAGDKQELLTGHGVIEYGHYAEQLEAYYELFSPNQFLILIFEEDIVNQPAHGLRKVCEFLEVDPGYAFSGLTERVNEGRFSLPGAVVNYYLPMLRRVGNLLNRHLPPYRPDWLRPSQATVEKFYRHYAPHNERLFALLGRDIPAWRQSQIITNL